MELQDKLHMDEGLDESQARYLTFVTDHQLFALPITEIVQIAQMQEIIPMPDQSDYVKGIINLRGQIIPVIDIRLRFGKPEAAVTERTCIIIAHVQGNDFGLLVDEVDEVADIEVEQISAPPKIGAGASQATEYMTGIARLTSSDGQKERVVLLLHAGKILGADEFMALSAAATDQGGIDISTH